jgi:pyruvate dehydrogenase E1 component alpha subunit
VVVPGDWGQLLRTMIIVRSFDDEVAAALARPAERPGAADDPPAAAPAGGGQGREGWAPARCNEGTVAVLGALLGPGDTVTSAEPAHLAVLAGGAPLAATLAELLGDAHGLCGGRSGPAGIADPGRDSYGVDRPLGRSLRWAAGAALAAQCLDRRGVTVAVAGPASLRSGGLPEVLELAAGWQLPLVVVLTRRGDDGDPGPLPGAAQAGPLEQVTVDRDDVIALRAVLAQAIERARLGGGPSLVDAMRAAPQSLAGAPGAAPGAVPSDPILRLALAVLRAGGAVPGALDELRDRSRAEVRAARDLVRSWTLGTAQAGANGANGANGAVGAERAGTSARSEAGAGSGGEQ